tara:strand:+ start:288 stop:497 length:210 start_codon:yes stop_codon:yes gene_type:complete
MNEFNPKELQGFDTALFNQQQYKMAHLQRWVESRCIVDHSQLLKASTAIEASGKAFNYVQDWASRTNQF